MFQIMNAIYLPASKLPEIFLSGMLPLVPKTLIFISASVPAKGTRRFNDHRNI